MTAAAPERSQHLVRYVGPADTLEVDGEVHQQGDVFLLDDDTILALNAAGHTFEAAGEGELPSTELPAESEPSDPAGKMFDRATGEEVSGETEPAAPRSAKRPAAAEVPAAAEPTPPEL